MLKHLRMAAKLMLGFGLLLLVFAGTIFIVWRDLSNIEKENEYLNARVVPVMQAGALIERSACELFLSIKDVQSTEEDAAIATSREWIKKLEAVLGDMAALGSADATLATPKRVQKYIMPVHRSYVQSLQETFTAIGKKKLASNALNAVLTEIGKEIEVLQKKYFEAAKTELDNPAAMMKRLDLLHTGSRMRAAVVELRGSVQEFLRIGTPETIEMMMKNLQTVENCSRTVKDQTRDSGRLEVVNGLVTATQNVRNALTGFIQAVENLNRQKKARSQLEETYNRETSNSSKVAQDRVLTVSRSSVNALRKSVLILFLSAGISILIGVLIAFCISRSITGPLNVIVALAKRCQEGDLTITRKDFGYEGKDELGYLVVALSEMISAQEWAMKRVVDVASAVESGANNLAAIAEETNASMEEVKASIDQVSVMSENNGSELQQSNTGVEEMRDGADTVARSATETAAFISQTTDASHRAIQTVNAVIDGMRGVDKNSRDSEAKIRQLVTSVENVSSFVSVITGIADQTNLLALNAAIEAARAGEAGRGFAVVAEEVRKLAEESARAAQNVGNIITELQREAQESIAATTEAGQMLEGTLVQAEEAQKALNGALEEINKANDSIQNIAAVAEEQAASSREIAAGIGKVTQSMLAMMDTTRHIHRATEETSKAAQSVAEQSEVMSSHSQSLSEALARFRLCS
ncbi:MAG: methyl-accepting chemotaxis protein [Synergistaceae bacterium]|jgi:methyl-accepting chemotaxis protein|nr:methyl-accepting chemotaxis protein [Synergistaceae bacterium]